MRGYQKKVIHIKKTNSALFDEAYFIVKNEAELSSLDEDDMVVEATRIIDESLDGCESGIKRGRQERLKKFLPPFFLGTVFSSVVSVCVYLILLL